MSDINTMPNDSASSKPGSTDVFAATPLSKRRKLELLSTMRPRNGGENTSFLTPDTLDATCYPSAVPPTTDDIDSGSDTEDEGNEELAQYYLNKMTDDTERKVETVFGKGVKVWRDSDGTVYAELTNLEAREKREKELWNQEALDKLNGGLKRKMGAEVKSEEKEVVKEVKTEEQAVKTEEQVVKKCVPGPTKPWNPKKNVFARLHNQHISSHQTPPAPIPSPKTPYPPRDPTVTQFHHSSAGIDPLGAHNRPILPLPMRRRAAPQPVSEGNSTTLRTMPSKHSYAEGQQVYGANQLCLPSPQALLSLPARSERIVSGSFGSFEVGLVDRFEEREYRFLPASRREERTKEYGQGGQKVLDVFKGQPWLRR